MLTYLINVTDDMLVVSLLIGVILAFMDHFSDARGKLITRLPDLSSPAFAHISQIQDALSAAGELEPTATRPL